MNKEGKEYFEKLHYKRLRKVEKARRKILNILQKYDCEYFEIVKLEAIDTRLKTIKKLKKTFILGKEKVVCANCGSDNWVTDSSKYEGDSGVDCKGTYMFEFMCPDCKKINKATFNCVDVKLLKKTEL